MLTMDVATRDAAIAAALERGVSLTTICELFDLSTGSVLRIAESAGVEPPVEQPGPATIHSARDAEMVRRALGGEDFTAISKSYGISRERVRQIIQRHTGLGGRDLSDVRRFARDAVKRQHALDIADQERDASAAEIGRRVGLTGHEVEQLLGVAEAARRRRDRNVTDATDEAEIVETLRRVAALPGGVPLSGPFYDAHRDGGLTSTRLIQIYGTWTAACEKAGVQPPVAPRKDYSQRWSRDDCLQWVGKYLQSTDRPSFARFDAWAREQEGAPSSGTVRLRCGKCTETMRAAGELLSEG